LSSESGTQFTKFDYEGARTFVHEIILHNPHKVLVAVLESVRNSLADTVDAIRKKTRKGGPEPYKVGPFVLMNLAAAFDRFVGQTPAQNIDGPFGRFVVDAIHAIGWNATWVEAHLRAAVSEWRALTRRKLSQKKR